VINFELRKEYTTVKIPTELANRLDAVAKDLGYSSRAEIVSDAVRRYIELRNYEIEHSHNVEIPILKTS
jgi:metal-responsive CopG/Arc/MetJ family transcriptional regulator